MKQPEDHRTTEMFPMPLRRGRPPLGERAMSPAEKQRAYRARVAAQRALGTAAQTRVALVAELQWALGALDKAVEAAAADLESAALARRVENAQACAEHLWRALGERCGFKA